MNINEKKEVKRNKDTIFKEVDKKVYILDSKNSTIHTLNETASFIWRKLDKPIKVGNLVDMVSKNFEVEKKKAKRDILEFINNYIKQGYIKTNNS